MKPCVYILLLENGQYYIGSTVDLERRIHEHNFAKTSGIKYSKPQQIVFSQEFETLSEARKVEYHLKRYKNRKVIEKIIEEGIIKKIDGPVA